MTKTDIPNKKEIRLTTDEFIVSKTDTHSNILYINRVFMQISGFTENELIDQPHNLIRHPDMPKGVFKLLWETLQTGDEFLGYVKNICKDGSFYWVFAHVTPDFDDDNRLKGYYSVRRSPTRKAIDTMSEVYQQMLLAEKGLPAKQACDESIHLLQSILKEKKLTYIQFVQQLDEPESIK